MPHLDPTGAPAEVRFRYSGETQPHTGTIHVLPVGTMVQGEDPTLEQKGGGNVLFSVGIADFIDTFAESFDAGTSFGFADIYAIDPTSGIRSFIYSVDLNDTGASVDTNVALVEGVFVFKSTVGKPIKIYTMEGVYTSGARSIGTVPADGRQDMVDYILSDLNIVYGKTDGWPQSFRSFTSKVNDALRRREGFGGV